VTLLVPQADGIPLPTPSELSRPYWEGCAAGELRFQRCGRCGGATHTPAVVCAHCTSRALTWEVSSGQGEVYSWTVVWRPQTSAFTVPYAPVIVAMEEGWFLLSNLIGCDHTEVAVGLAVQVELHPVGDGVHLPYVRPR
jgi:uncharacterized OB-fold protein